MHALKRLARVLYSSGHPPSSEHVPTCRIPVRQRPRQTRHRESRTTATSHTAGTKEITINVVTGKMCGMRMASINNNGTQITSTIQHMKRTSTTWRRRRHWQSINVAQNHQYRANTLPSVYRNATRYRGMALSAHPAHTKSALLWLCEFACTDSDMRASARAGESRSSSSAAERVDPESQGLTPVILVISGGRVLACVLVSGARRTL